MPANHPLTPQKQIAAAEMSRHFYFPVRGFALKVDC
jgi:hypothetical protein